MRAAHRIRPVHVGEMGDPLFGRLRRQHDVTALALQQAVVDRVDLRHHGGGLDEMGNPLEPAPVGDHLAPVHRRLEERELVRRRHRHHDS